MYSPSGSGCSSSSVELLLDSDQGPITSEEIRDETTRTWNKGDKLNSKDRERQKGNPLLKNFASSNPPRENNNNGQSAFQPIRPTATPFGQPFIPQFYQVPQPPFFICNNYTVCLLPVLVPNPMSFIQINDPGVFVPQENLAPMAPPNTAGSSLPKDPNFPQQQPCSPVNIPSEISNLEQQPPCSRVNTPLEICDSLVDFCAEVLDRNNCPEGAASDEVHCSTSSATSDGIVEALQNSETQVTRNDNLQGNFHVKETDIQGMNFHGPSQHSIQNMHMIECEVRSSEDITDDFEERISNCVITNSDPRTVQDRPLEVPVTEEFNSLEIQEESTESELEEPPILSPEEEGTLSKTSHLLPKQTIRIMKHVRISPCVLMDPGKSLATSMPASVPSTSQDTSRSSDPHVVDANKENVPFKLMLVSAELAKAVASSVVLPSNNDKLLKGYKTASARRGKGKKRRMKSKRVKKTPARYQNEFIEPPTKRRKGRPSKNSHGARPHSSNSAIKKWNLRPSTSAQRFNSSEFNDESDSESGLTDDEKKVLVTIEYQ